MAERGVHQCHGKMSLSLLELLQRDSSARNGKKMEVAALGVLKKVLRLHSWLECVNKSLRGYRHLLGNLRRIHGVGRRSIPAGISNQRQQPDNAYQQRQT